MKLSSVKLVYFSPTGTTKAAVQGIARGLGFKNMSIVDATSPETRERDLEVADSELLIVGGPVYMGRLPKVFSDWLKGMKGGSFPAVSVVVYGNRAYENSLLELADIVADKGGVTVACGAFVGEHSFSTTEKPTAHGRPDSEDMSQAEEFGRKLRRKLDSLADIKAVPEFTVPGERPYGGKTQLWDVDFIAVNENCGQCGTCVDLCPVGAIDPQDCTSTDIVKCITCCACIKGCPQNARSIKPGQIMDASAKLNANCSKRQAPEYYL